MTDMEKGVMVRLCAKILAETDLYETDAEVRDLIDWVCVSGQMKENNNKIRSLTGEYKQIEPECREGVYTMLNVAKKAEIRLDKTYVLSYNKISFGTYFLHLFFAISLEVLYREQNGEIQCQNHIMIM